LEPRVAAKVGARYRALTAAVDSQAHEKAATATTTTLSAMRSPGALNVLWCAFSTCIAILVVLLYASICFHWGGPGAILLLTMLPMGMVATVSLPGVLSPSPSKTAARPSAAGSLRAPRGRLVGGGDLLRHAFRDAAAGDRAEQIYGEIIVILATAAGGRGQAARDLLRECNALLTSHFGITAHQERVRRALDENQAIVRAATEQAQLRQRLDAEADPVARRSLEQSLELCEERIQHVQALVPLLARLVAHQEVICQALSLAHAVLLREQAAPHALRAPDVTGLRETARRVISQTRAVEEAVAHVMHH
jgi:hypothetical protein